MVGTIFSHYRIMEKLSQGGMGTVYKAEDTRLRRIVALKLLSTNLTEDIIAKQRFEREAQAAAALNHQNVVTIYEIGEFDRQTYISMEYIEGKSLRQVIDKEQGNRPTIPFDGIVAIACQVCEGLSEAHKLGIIHRDIKPGNLITDLSGRTKILDFGLAKLKGVSKLTKERTSLGTIYYMSPEQILGENVDYRTDIWSLGVVLYEMITGEVPFKGDYEPEVVYFIANRKPKAISELNPEVPTELTKIVDKALEKNKENRYQNIDDMKTDLLAVSRTLQETDKIHQRGISKPNLIKLRVTTHHGIRHRTGIFLMHMFHSSLFVKGAWVFSCAAILVLVLWIYRSSLMKGDSIPEPKSIAIISFENCTQEKAYDYLQAAIPNLLIMSLEQSKYLRVTTWERLHDLLKQLKREAPEFIDEGLGIELCTLDNIDILALGTFSKKGELFSTTIKVIDMRTRSILLITNSEGDGVGSIIRRQIDNLSEEISHCVGLTDNIHDANQLPISEMSTNSMEAYNYFLRGRFEWEKYYHENARQFLEKAAMLDSTFAIAHLYLAWAHGALGNSKEMMAAYERAKAFSRKATEKDRLQIESDYAILIEKDHDKYFHILNDIVRKYPKEKSVHYSLGSYFRYNHMFYNAIGEYDIALQLDPNYGEAINDISYTYALMGDFKKAIQYSQKYAAISPGDANPFDSMAEIYFRMGKLDEAIQKYKEALEVKPDFYQAYLSIGYLYAIQENYDETMNWLNKLTTIAPSKGIKAEIYILRGFYYFWLGSVEKSLSDIHYATELIDDVENDLWKAYSAWVNAWISYELGNTNESRDYFRDWYELVRDYPLPDMQIQSQQFYESELNLYLCLLDIKEGEIESANSRMILNSRLLREINQSMKERNIYYRSQLQLEISRLGKTTDRLTLIDRGESTMGIPPYMRSRYILLYNLPFMQDAYARICLQKGDLDQAIAEYERLVTPDPIGANRRLIHPQYHYRLARLYEEKGFLQEAMDQYETFLKVWENADSTRPALIDAKRRLQIVKSEIAEGRR